MGTKNTKAAMLVSLAMTAPTMLTSANLNIVPGQSSKGANGSESKAKMNAHRSRRNQQAKT